MKSLIIKSSLFESESNVKLHYAGLPYSRYMMAESVKQELSMLLLVSLIVTSIILFIFFRSYDTVIVPIIIIGIYIFWTDKW